MTRPQRPRRGHIAPAANAAISSAREPTLSTSDTPPNPVEGDSTTLGVAPENVPTPGESGIEKARLKASLMGKLFGAAPAAVQIGRFRVLDHVGEGGMGTIYSAYDDQLDRKVAVKVLHSNLGRGARERLMREAKALAQLSHPNVVTVHEVGEHEDCRPSATRSALRTTPTWPRSRPRTMSDEASKRNEPIIGRGRTHPSSSLTTLLGSASKMKATRAARKTVNPHPSDESGLNKTGRALAQPQPNRPTHLSRARDDLRLA